MIKKRRFSLFYSNSYQLEFSKLDTGYPTLSFEGSTNQLVLPKLGETFHLFRLKQPASRLSSIVQGRNIPPRRVAGPLCLGNRVFENKAISDSPFHRLRVPAVSRRLCIPRPPFLPALINVPPDSYCSRGRRGGGEKERGERGGMSIRNENRADRQTGTSKLVKNRSWGI